MFQPLNDNPPLTTDQANSLARLAKRMLDAVRKRISPADREVEQNRRQLAAERLRKSAR